MMFFLKRKVAQFYDIMALHEIRRHIMRRYSLFNLRRPIKLKCIRCETPFGAFIKTQRMANKELDITLNCPYCKIKNNIRL